jgi:type I restriction enzyme S subunit
VKEGWKEKPLGEVCTFLNRGISPVYIPSGGIRILNQRCVRDHSVLYEPARWHDATVKKVGPERFLQVGDVLVNSTGEGTLGRVAQLREAPGEPTTVDSHVTIVRPNPELFHQDFFGFMLILIEDEIANSGVGLGGQTELARAKLANDFRVSYPEAKSEQQRIVGILDDAFDGIAKAKAKAEQNLANARAIFASFREAVFTQNREGWTQKPLGALATFRNGINYTKGSKGDSVKVVGVGDFRNEYWVPTENLAKVSIDGRVSPDDLLRSGDILTVRSNGNVALIGRSMLAGEVPVGVTHSGFTIRSRLISDELRPSYLCHFMRSDTARKRLVESGTGTNIKSLNQQALSQLSIPVAPPVTQEKIVSEIEFLSQETRRLEGVYERKLCALESLKQSLLHQAFTGAL